MITEVTENQREALLLAASASPEAFADAFGSDVLAQIRQTFHDEGYVIVRGLLDADFLEGLEDAAQNVVEDAAKAPNLKPGPSTFTSLKFGPVFSSPPESRESDLYDNDSERKSPEDAAGTADRQYFREVALSSAVPRFISRVLLDLAPSRSLRVLKDAFLAKGKEENHCGWHVDDYYFWPTTAVDPSAGVNAWIALDDIPASTGGGMAVSPGSHRAEWRHEAYRTIGSTQVFPAGGFGSLKEMYEKARPQTCNLIETGAELNSRIERTKVLPDYRSGDVLFCTRWLFHRSVPITGEGRKLFDDVVRQDPGRTPTFKRYTVRYEPGTARLLEGYAMDPSILFNEENGGKTLDEVCLADGPWYPRCWPSVDEDEMRDMQQLVEKKFPIANAIETEQRNLLRKLRLETLDKRQETMGK